MKRIGRVLLFVLAAFGFVVPAHAHIGSKDVFEQVSAGPYKLFVTVRTPNVIPGVATIEVRTSGAAVSSIRITPIPLTGEASKHPPSSDTTQRSAVDPAFFTGSLWLMAQGSWQVRFEVDGAAGAATASVPVPAVPLAILPMQTAVGHYAGCAGTDPLPWDGGDRGCRCSRVAAEAGPGGVSFAAAASADCQCSDAGCCRADGLCGR